MVIDLRISWFSSNAILDKLNRQNASYRNPSHELRSACFTALQLALDSRRPKFIALGLSGLQVIST